MKLEIAPDDLHSTMLFHRRVSENGLVEMGVYRVMFGWRVRAGFVGKMSCALDWCGGGNWTDVERLYSLCFSILSNKQENYQCFDDLPPISMIKPFYLDHDFVKIVGEKAKCDSDEFKLFTLNPHSFNT